ncbi:methylmalonyl-CoA mutase family protein [Nakamurella endophytica]|uniref:Methylmalonyl-CoA mutase n=1 Tax=Nakamurella endophytica TaxID=1748367 RepID=A0A917SX14_9ACTN|nr:methylmalonyl-CoA mutase family protein [Nakamurella endophytica]GGM01950.1 methylmalonyl-CoA mutase [Nakamurella endophytica]
MGDGDRDGVGPALDAEPPARRDQWVAAAAAVLSRAGTSVPPDADPRALLERRTVEDVPVPVLGLDADLSGGTPARAVASTGQDGVRRWDLRARIAAGDAAAAAADVRDELAGGSTSLWIPVGDRCTAPDDLSRVLADVRPDAVPVAVQPVGDTTAAQAADALVAWADRSGAPLHPDTSVGADPVGRLLTDGAGDPDVRGELAATARRAAGRGIRTAVVDATAAHHRGAGESRLLGYAVATGVAYLRALVDAGLDPAAAFAALEFRLPITDDVVVGVATLRAVRVLWARVAELSEVSKPAARARLHAVTSWPMLGRYDPWVNVLRGTAAAFAAAAGGADAVTVLPHDAPGGAVSAAGRRLARTTPLLLEREAVVRRTADPAAGSYAIEVLTDRLAERAWAECAELDSRGVAAAAADGTLPARWAASAEERRRRVATRRQPITGTTAFPSTADDPLARPAAGTADPLSGVARWSADFEELRDVPATEPVAVLVLGGTPRGAAAGPVVEALSTVGVPSATATVTTTPDDAVRSWRTLGAPAVVCLVPGAAEPPEWAADLPGLLRSHGARLVLAAPPRGTATAVRWSGPVDGDLDATTDLPDLGRRVRAAAAGGSP